MQSIQRSIMLLRPGDGPHISPQGRGTLKLQALPAGLMAQLSTIGLEPGEYALYLFLQDGAAIFAGDVTPAGLYRVLPGIRLNNVAGAAVIHSASLSFCLKSTNMDWTKAQPRFSVQVDANVQRVLANAVQWAAPRVQITDICPMTAPLEPLSAKTGAFARVGILQTQEDLQ